MEPTIEEIIKNQNYTHLRVDDVLWEIVTRTPDDYGQVVLKHGGGFVTRRLADLEGATGETPYMDAPTELWFERTRHYPAYWYSLSGGIFVSGLRGGSTVPPRLLQEAECAVYVFDRFETVQPDPDLVAASEKMRLEEGDDGDDS